MRSLCILALSLLAVTCTSESSVPTDETSIELFANGETFGGHHLTFAKSQFSDIGSLARHLRDQWRAAEEEQRSAFYKKWLADNIQPFVGTPTLASSTGAVFRSPDEIPSGARVYWIPPGKLFVWPSVYVGHKVTIPDVFEDDTSWVASLIGGAPKDRSLVLETLSFSPRVFFVENFITSAEADQLIENVLNIQSPAHKLQRSTVGHKPRSTSATGKNGDSVYSSVRTSENAFDTDSREAVRIMRRAFRLLRVGPFVHSWADGIQLLRYNLGEAYIAHHDYFGVGSSSDHNWDPQRNGTNRFATVFLYLSDVEDGGQTVFPVTGRELLSNTSRVPPAPSPEHDTLKQAMVDKMGANSWQMDMVKKCDSQLSVYPKKGSAVVFYSQGPSGALDPNSLHGGCPVLAGQKWAANLWVWNGPRYGVPAERGTAEDANRIEAIFVNKLKSPVKLFFDGKPWADIAAKSTYPVNTFPGHHWQIQKDGVFIQEWIMSLDKGKKQQLVIAKKRGARQEL